ncbi:MAG: hypothetical protein ACPLY9_01790 [Nitrososphaerales archaeon]
MTSKFLSIPFDQIMKRLFKSGWDTQCCHELAESYFGKSSHDVRLCLDKYKKSGKGQKVDEIKKISRKCTELPIYSNYDWQEVVFDIIARLDMPRKWFNYVFGHVNDEKELYDLTAFKKFLKEEFKEYSHKIPTYDKRSKIGIRYADFTFVKKFLLGRYEIFSVDVKVNHTAFDYYLNQAHDFLTFSDYTTLICTPGLILKVGTKWGDKPIEAEKKFKDRLDKVGIGLYIFDVVSGAYTNVLDAEESEHLDKNKKNKALQELGIL